MKRIFTFLLMSWCLLCVYIPLSHAVDLDYILTIDDPSSHQATVKLTVTNISGDIFSIKETGYHGLKISVLSLSAYDESGEKLVTTHLPNSVASSFGDKADVWNIQCKGLDKIIVEYIVQPGKIIESGKGHIGYIALDFALLAGEYVFLVPTKLKTNTIKLSFNLPANWNIFTPWTQKGAYYDPDIFGTDLIESLSISCFALGNFESFSKVIGSTEVNIIVYQPWSNEVKNELINGTLKIIEYQTSLFGTSVGNKYLAAFCPDTVSTTPIYGGEWSTSQGYSVTTYAGGSLNNGNWSMLSHQTFHRWNGWAWGTIFPQWFGEGANEFYAYKIPQILNFNNTTDFQNKLKSDYDTYMNDYVYKGLDKPLPVGGENKSSKVFLIYNKGMMVSFLIAKEIYQRTNGSSTFDDFMELLFKKYGYYSAPCQNNCLKQELESLTGTDFTQFFNDYVDGITTLPMDWAFKDADGDSLSNANEIAWNTDPSNEDTDIDGYSDYIEILENSNPLSPQSIPINYYKPALPINIDGYSNDWSSYTPVGIDPKGDSKSSSATDIKQVYLEVDPNFAYIMLENFDFPIPESCTIELNLDILEGDGNLLQLHTNIGSNNSFSAWVDKNNNGALEDYSTTGEIVIFEDVMEMLLPLKNFNSPQKIKILYANFWTTHNGNWDYVDVMYDVDGVWKTVSSNSAVNLITIKSDLSFKLPEARYQPLTGDVDLWVDFKFFGDQGGKLLWKLQDYGTAIVTGTPITIASDLSFSIPNATYQSITGDINLEVNFKFFGDQGGKLLWKLDTYSVK